MVPSVASSPSALKHAAKELDLCLPGFRLKRFAESARRVTF